MNCCILKRNFVYICICVEAPNDNIFLDHYFLFVRLILSKSLVMRVPFLLFQLGLLYTVRSSPVASNAVKPKAGPPFLALLLTLGALLLFLFVMKWVYIVRRRKAHHKRSYLRSGWYDNLSGTSPSRLRHFIGIPGDEKSGFFIGLLGSPNWETRYSAVISKSPDQCSLLHTNSVSSHNSEYPIACPSDKHNRSSPVPEKTTPSAETVEAYQGLCLKLPSLAKVVNKSPLLSDSEYMQVVSGPISPLLSGLTSVIPSNSKNSMTDAGTPSEIITASQPPSTPGNRTSLGNLCFPVPSVKEPPPCLLKSPLISKLGTRASLEPFQHDAAIYSYIPAPATEVKKNPEKILATSPLQDLVQSLDSKLNASCDELPSNFQPTSGTPTPPFRPIRTERNPTEYVKPRIKTGRKRVSPKLGPSPLRTIIHPSEYGTNSCDILSSNQHDSSLCSTHKLSDVTNQLPSCKRDRLSKTGNSRWKKSADADSLLNLMAELVQETSVWDSSLFVDDNFKALVSRLDPQPEQKLKVKRQSYRLSRSMRYRYAFTPLEDIPEVDGMFNVLMSHNHSD